MTAYLLVEALVFSLAVVLLVVLDSEASFELAEVPASSASFSLVLLVSLAVVLEVVLAASFWNP